MDNPTDPLPAGEVGRTASRCESLEIRGLRYNVRRWGREDARPLLLLHGSQDSSITFQFVVDALKSDWSIAAPDWRGHGRTDWAPGRYWFHEFVADLDRLMTALFPDRPVAIVGHSLGANIGGVYAGLRPARVSQFISLDGFGPLLDAVPVDARAILEHSLAAETGREHVAYCSVDDVAVRLTEANPRLTRERALFLAEGSTIEGADCRRRWLFDPNHRRTIPSIHAIGGWYSVWSGIEADVFWLVSSDERPHAPNNDPSIMDERAAMMKVRRRAVIPDTGHNLHHDAPEIVAASIEAFLEHVPVGRDVGTLPPLTRSGGADAVLR
jgi:pimeloyl-ACP methyl ester carboxylesterase